MLQLLRVHSDLDSRMKRKNDFRSATAQRKSAEKHEGKKRATNKHGMCFVEEKNAKQFLCETREEKNKIKFRAGTVKAFWFTRFDCPSRSMLHIRIKCT